VNNSRIARLGFGASQRIICRGGLSGVVCLAVDDGMREKQQELVSNVVSAEEDRPGETPKPIIESPQGRTVFIQNRSMFNFMN
jgi:hypothetical protein